MTLDQQIEADFKKHGTLSVPYLQRKYRMSDVEARKYLRRFESLITRKLNNKDNSCD